MKRQIYLADQIVEYYDSLLDCFGLFETLRFSNNQLVDLDLHLDRLIESCAQLDLPKYQPNSNLLEKIFSLMELNKISNPAVRIAWISNNNQYQEFVSIRENPYKDPQAVFKLKLVEHPILNEGKDLRYKLNSRKRYMQDKELYRTQGFDEVVYFVGDEKNGQIYEGAVTNIYIKQDNQMKTPPLTLDILPGIERKKLVASGSVVEAPITVEDLQGAEQIFISNSLMGVMQAVCS